jgi:Na+-driven multidrug efflux pump
MIKLTTTLIFMITTLVFAAYIPGFFGYNDSLLSIALIMITALAIIPLPSWFFSSVLKGTESKKTSH